MPNPEGTYLFVARELAPAGLRSGPKFGAGRNGSPSASSGSKLPRHRGQQFGGHATSGNSLEK
ncbi:hypothetical protein F7R05_17340 [Pseudomonas koreensis]|nr:hypothetical protein F7R05_17340 [Pseudomonas koreensis]